MQLFHVLLALVVVVVWGFNFVVIKVGLEEISPLLLGFGRFFLTSIPAIFFIKRPIAPFKMIAWYGLIMFALQFSLLFIGMYHWGDSRIGIAAFAATGLFYRDTSRLLFW